MHRYYSGNAALYFYEFGNFGRERKLFMGDAGSMMIGFTVIWLLLGVSKLAKQNR